MLYINPKERAKLTKYHEEIYQYLKRNKLRYSDQREKVLKLLYEQSKPVSIDFLAQQLGKIKSGIGYATVSRHMKFFEALELVAIVNKIPKSYILCLFFTKTPFKFRVKLLENLSVFRLSLE